MTGRRRTWVVLALAVLAVVGLMTIAAARAAAILAAHQDELLAAVGNTIGWPVEADNLDVSWFPPAVIARQVRVPDESPYGPGTLASADEARFEIALLQLLRGRLVVEEVHLQAPVVRVVRGADGGWNLKRRLPPEPPEPREPRSEWLAPRVVVDKVRVRNARLTYRDRGIAGLGELELRSGNLRLSQDSDGVSVDFNAQALGGPEGNVTGSLRIPPADDAQHQAHLSIEADRLQAVQLAEVVGVLRGHLPFGASFGGELGARVDATMPAAWPPGTAAIALNVEGRKAGLRAAAGWVDKQPGAPFQAEVALRAEPSGLAVDRAVLRIGSAEVRAEADGAPPSGIQPPLRLAVDRLDAGALAQLMPSLAALSPRGALGLTGRLTPGTGPIAGSIELTAGALAATAGKRPIEAGGGVLRLMFSDDGERVLGSLHLDRVRSEDASAASIEATIGGPLARPLIVSLTATGGELNGAPLERATVELALGEDSAEIRAARADAFGGFLTATGRVARDASGTWQIAAAPHWEGIELASLLAAADQPRFGRGSLGGDAQLATSGLDVAGALDNLAGSFSITLERGQLTDVNLAAATLENLRSVPRLREAVEKRARDQVPELLASTSAISHLTAAGQITGRALSIDRLVLVSDDYDLDARGRIGFDGATELSGTLSLSPSAAQAIVSEAGITTLLAQPGGQVHIPIAVHGVYPRLAGVPTSDFLSHLAARALTAPGSDTGADWLRRLLGRGARSDADAPAGR